jgi:(2R)-3-sulfolactate dehydrogenase (NADP+)
LTSAPASALVRASTDLLQAAGLPARRAHRSAAAIVLADRWRIGSHGLMRLPFYLTRLEAGGIDPKADLREVRRTTSVVAFDGGGGLGHWQVWSAVDTAVGLSRASGVGVAAVGNSSHSGALGVYANRLREAGQAGLVLSNGPAAMPAWGGSRPVLSTSPIAGAVPSPTGGAVVDMATSTVTRGRIVQYAQDNRPLEPGWAFDSTGTPTTDPKLALSGMIAPVGGAKGFALAYLIESLTGGLIGPLLSRDVVDPFAANRASEHQGVSHLVVAIDPRSLDVDGRHEDRLSQLEKEVAASGGRVPGRRRIKSSASIEIEPDLMRSLLAWAERLDARIAVAILANELTGVRR